MTSANDDVKDERSRVGLCVACTHASRIVSARGSTFYLCAWSKVDPAFPRYPRLPVVSCTAFTPSTNPSDGA